MIYERHMAVSTEGARYRVAGFWRRAAASVIDGVLLVPPVLLFGGASALVAGQNLPRPGELGPSYVVQLAVDGGASGVVALAMSALVVVLYVVTYTAMRGRTPGQRAMSVHVIDIYGAAPSVGRALLRTLATVLSVVLCGLGVAWIAFSREKRGLHDLLAGTYVVLDEAARTKGASSKDRSASPSPSEVCS